MTTVSKIRVRATLEYIESNTIYLVLEEKRRDIVFGFPWCVVFNACFRISSRYIIFIYIFDFEYEDVQNEFPFFPKGGDKNSPNLPFGFSRRRYFFFILFSFFINVYWYKLMGFHGGSPLSNLLLAVPWRLFCLGSFKLVILDVVYRQLSLFLLYINIKTGKNRCLLLD